MRSMLRFIAVLACFVSMWCRAEVSEIKVGVPPGVLYLQFYVMAHENLLDKHAKAAGLPGLKLTLVQLEQANAMTDAALAGAIDYGSGGVSGFLTLWSRTINSLGVKSIGGLVAMPMYLNVKNPNVKTIKDFTDKDKIGVAGIKVSYQAMLIQMAASQAFGEKNFGKLDSLTVTVSNPNGYTMLGASVGELTAHFAPPPYAYWEMKLPGVRTILKSYDILGGPATLVQTWTTTRFHDANPKAFQAFLNAYKEATDIINKEKRRSAEMYLKVANDKKSTVEELLEIFQDPEVIYSVTPRNTMPIAEFMHRSGTIPVRPGAWKDMYFSEIHSLPGS